MSHGDGGTLPSPNQSNGGTRYVTIRIDRDLLISLSEVWSEPVHLRFMENPDGTFALALRTPQLKHIRDAVYDPMAETVPETPIHLNMSEDNRAY